MPTLTLAEALAQIAAINRRLDKKQQLVLAFLLRPQQYRDPLRAESGSPAVLARELKATRVLHERRVRLRRLIQNAYERTKVTFGEQTRSLADWLAWRRDVAARRGGFLHLLRSRITKARQQAARQGRGESPGTAPERGADVIVHLDEQELARQIEGHEELLGYLDGQLALKNATVTIDVPDGLGDGGLEERLEVLLQRSPAAPVAAPAPTPGDPWSTSSQLRAMARDPVQKIAAIKLYRELTQCGLLEAKNAVEAYMARHRV
jgi:hypothetical protein